jgi:hypothetical protein
MYGWTQTKRLAALGLLGTLLMLLPACKQGEGERCQINDDCGDNLYCEYSGNTKTMGGYCKSTIAAATTLDLSTPPTDQAAAPVDMTSGKD